MACRLVGLSRSAYRRPLKGDTGADSSVAGEKGEKGDTGADSTVAGQTGASQLAGSCQCSINHWASSGFDNCKGYGAASTSSGSTCRCDSGTVMQGVNHFKVCIAP